jgi:hypothetical protein
MARKIAVFYLQAQPADALIAMAQCQGHSAVPVVPASSAGRQHR